MTIRTTSLMLGFALSLPTLFAEYRPVMIAHRGGAAVRPENTPAAFRHAIDLGVEVLEFDMNLTADDQIVIHHDSTVNGKICRADAGSGVSAGPIRKLTLAQIRRFECGSFQRADSPHFRAAPGERMPTLDEFLETVKKSKVLLLGETKMPVEGGVPPEKFAELIEAAIRKHEVADKFVLQSSDYRTTDEMRKRNPAVRICLLNARKYKPNYLEIARKHGATHLMLRADDATAEQIFELKQAGLVLYSGTANSKEDWERFVRLEFHGILTDDPVELQTFLVSRGLR